MSNQEISLTPTPAQPAVISVTPMLKQYLEIKEQHRDAILFFRMGDFYEMFLEDAKLAAPLLDIALTCRDRNSDNPIPMCGVPYHSADAYIAKLVQRGLRVAICEQVEDPKLARGLVKREVIRIVTPGTYMPEAVVNTSTVNYVAAGEACDGQWGLAYCDLATGDFRLTEFVTVNDWLDELLSIEVRELIIPEAASELRDAAAALERRGLRCSLRGEGARIFDDAERTLTKHFQARSLRGLGLGPQAEAGDGGKAPAVRAAGALLSYLQQTQRAALCHLDQLRYYRRSDTMLLDEATRRNLELVRGAHTWTGETARPSLFDVLNRCVTAMGERELRDWLLKPLTEEARILARQQVVVELQQRSEVLQALRQALAEVRDLQRLNARLALGRTQPRDLLSLRLSLERLPAARQSLAGTAATLLQSLAAELRPHRELVELLGRALADEPPLALQDGGVIRAGYNAELDELRGLQKQGKEWLAALELQEKQRTGIASLKVRYNQVFGYYIEVTRSNLAQVPADYQRKQTLVNAERFITPQLKEYEEKVLSASERVLHLEERLFNELRQRAAAEHGELHATAAAVARLDALQSLASTAIENNYVAPQLDDSGAIDIRAGRHPVVEQQLQGERYVPNDLLLDTQGPQLLLVTGPNMAGKSTLLRQTALITLMAQIGSCVPASAVRLGLVDRIFTRIGAADDIAMGRSTFMVEMEETAAILRSATQRSLLILDEIGRGTSTFDGLSIAWAIVEHIHNQLGARTLFATHYHELTELAKTLPRLKNVHVAVREQQGKVIFLHRLLDGGVNRSYGISVARLAGLPIAVLSRAEAVLHDLEAVRRSAEPQTAPTPQMTLFASGKAVELQSALRDVDLNALTPLEALNLLAQWRRDFND